MGITPLKKPGKQSTTVASTPESNIKVESPAPNHETKEKSKPTNPKTTAQPEPTDYAPKKEDLAKEKSKPTNPQTTAQPESIGYAPTKKDLSEEQKQQRILRKDRAEAVGDLLDQYSNTSLASVDYKHPKGGFFDTLHGPGKLRQPSVEEVIADYERYLGTPQSLG